MIQPAMCLDLNDALACLLDKYVVEVPGSWRITDGREPPSESDCQLTFVPGQLLADPVPPQQIVPLLPWREQRRFLELKRLIEEETITPLLMCRFACLTDGHQIPLSAILYREFDLIEWLTAAPIVGLHASITEDRAANVIVRLAGGVVGSVEAGVMLPAGTAMQDRHELIARRGVASDRVVDTQVAQHSVYSWTNEGSRQHTDVDAELFGLDVEQVALVRAAFDVLSQPDGVAGLKQQHQHLRQLVALAHESNRRQERLTIET